MSENRATWIGVPDLYRLNSACRTVAASLQSVDCYGLVPVGSSLIKKDYRDVDVRAVLSDEQFATMFPSEAWLRMANAALSDWLATATGLPIDFQFQSISDGSGSEEHKHKGRHPLGLPIPFPYDPALAGEE